VLWSFQEGHEAEEKRVQERGEKIQEQVMLARENHSVIFNPQTGNRGVQGKEGLSIAILSLFM
jgi:hypothetical protein